MKHKIYIKDWLHLKPYSTTNSIDIYYLKLCNSVKKAILKSNSLALYKYVDEAEINLLSCFLTSYFEDIISETNIWNAFIKKHQKLYGKKLPFFNTKSYYEDEVNIQDVAFLIWYFLNTIQQESFLSPYNEFIKDLAQDVALILEEEYEYAPENEKLKSLYSLPVTDDYYTVRLFLDQILTKTYLFFTDTGFRLIDQEIDIVEKNKDEPEILIQYLRENRDQFVFNENTKLLSLYAKEWAALILGKEHPMTDDILNLSPRVQGLFLYKGQNEKIINLEHIATGKKFELKKESFDAHYDLVETDTILYIGMVQWKEEWWFSGISFQSPFDADVILDEKSALESRAVVDALHVRKNEQKYKEILAKQQEAFIQYNNGSQIKFLNSNKIGDFVNGFFEHYHQSLKLNKQKHQKAVERAKQEGLLLDNNKSFDFNIEENCAAIFFNPVSGLEIAIGVNSAFPIKDNPFYNEVDSNEDFWALITSKEYSKELVLYCMKNCKEELSFFERSPQNLYEKDFDFLLRFFKATAYHNKFNITLTGTK